MKAVRTCVACRKRSIKEELIRFVFAPPSKQFVLQIDVGSDAGRGAYCHRSCIGNPGLTNKLVERIKSGGGRKRGAKQKKKEEAVVVDKSVINEKKNLQIAEILEIALLELSTAKNRKAIELRKSVNEMLLKVTDVRKTTKAQLGQVKGSKKIRL